MPVVAFDADILSLILNPSLVPPNDPSTGHPVVKTTERLDEYLIADLEKNEDARDHPRACSE